jgi:transcriptional regulator with XRE-family HTH domain
MTAKAPKEPAPLQRIMAAHGLRACEVEAACGVDAKTIANLRHGRWQRLKVATLARVAVGLGVPVVVLVPALGTAPPAGLVQHRQAAAARARRPRTALPPPVAEPEGAPSSTG